MSDHLSRVFNVLPAAAQQEQKRAAALERMFHAINTCCLPESNPITQEINDTYLVWTVRCVVHLHRLVQPSVQPKADRRA